MCLAVPVKVVDIDLKSETATVEVDSVKVKVSTSLFPQVVLNDYVLVHAGFIIERLSEDDAKTILASFEEIGRPE